MSSVLITLGAKQLHVVPLNLVRCVVSTSFFWLLLPFYGGLEALASIQPSAWIWLVVSVLGLLVVGDTFFFRSMDLVGVSWAMPVASINPLWAVLLAALFVGEPLTWSLLVGALLVIAGVVLVSRGQDQGSTGEGPDPRARRTGLWLALAASVLWAVAQVALKPASEGVHSVVVNSVRQPLGASMLLVTSAFQRKLRDLRGLDKRSWAIIAVASLLGTGIGSLFFLLAIQRAGAGRTAVLTSTAPMLAIPFSVLWLRERPGRSTLFGTVLTVAGIALVA
jgi:drug/metabolite transporter (DMT)-like permease